jgi:hypothetical protein
VACGALAASGVSSAATGACCADPTDASVIPIAATKPNRRCRRRHGNSMRRPSLPGPDRTIDQPVRLEGSGTRITHPAAAQQRSGRERCPLIQGETGTQGPGDKRRHDRLVNPLEKHDTLLLTSVLPLPIAARTTPARPVGARASSATPTDLEALGGSMQIDGGVGSANRIPLSAGRSALTADAIGPGVRCAARSAKCRVYCYRPTRTPPCLTAMARDAMPIGVSCLGG